MVITELITLLLVAASGHWTYEKVDTFPEPGPCDSAARIDDVVAMGCRLGIWWGKASDLELAVSCAAREERPNRVRKLDGRSFVASTPCGLYRVNVDGGVTRLPHPPEPGALDTDEKGSVVVEAGGDLWLIEKEGSRRLSYHIRGSVERLQLAGDWLLVLGEQRWLLGLKEFHQEELSGWGLHAIFGRDRLLHAQPSGRALIRKVREPVGKVSRLRLLPAERVVALRGWGDVALVQTSIRWFLVGGKEPVAGGLPPVSGRAVPVEGGGEGDPPWMVVAGGLYRPVIAKTGDTGKCEIPDAAGLYVAAVGAQGLVLPPEPSPLAGWLPQVGLSAFGGQVRKVRWNEGGAWDYSSGSHMGVFVVLTWSLGRVLDGAREKLRESVLRERGRLHQRISLLVAAFKEHCRRGDQQALLEIRARIEMLTSGVDW